VKFHQKDNNLNAIIDEEEIFQKALQKKE